MFKKIALIAMMAFSLSLPMTAFATELNTLAITDTTQELSVSQMVDELYQNEKSETVKQLAHDLILTITGEKEPAHVYASGLVEIGTYRETTMEMPILRFRLLAAEGLQLPVPILLLPYSLTEEIS